MNKQKIAQIIENFAPLNLAEAWDCSGWLVNIANKSDIKKIMLCLTVTDDVVKQALENNCDMIISHHPLFFVPFEYKNINIYCAHTNFDKTEGGTTDKLIEVLGLPKGEPDNEFVRIVTLEQTVLIEDFSQKLANITDNLRLVNNLNTKEIKKIGFCAGSGSEFITDKVDAFVTGDVKFHIAVESKTVIFDVGHFESEVLSLKTFENLLKNNIDIIYAKEKSPFKSLTIKF